jgi:zinc transport system substrate-binding protein
MRHSMSVRGWMRCLVACVAGGLSTTPSGCASEPAADRLQVSATVAPLAGLVDRLVGPDVAEVSVMIPAGASPVTYEPTLARVRSAAAADVYVSVGHPAFAWETTWLAGILGRGSAVVVAAADGCDVLPDDPHVWLSLPCVRSMAIRIAEAVQEARPAAAEVIASSLSEFLAELEGIRADADSTLSPRQGGSFVALHPAWGYIANEYDLHQLAILEHGSGDAGPAELAAIVSQARQLGLVDIVVQPQFSEEAALLVAHELGGQPVLLDPLAREWSDSYRRAIQVLAAQVKP